MRIIGTTLIYPTETYSHWFPRSGDAATFIVEVLTQTMSGDGQFKITIETKNSEEDDTVPVGQQTEFSSIKTSVTRTSTRATGLLELVRFKFHWASGLTAGTFVHFRMLPPMWEFN